MNVSASLKIPFSFMVLALTLSACAAPEKTGTAQPQQAASPAAAAAPARPADDLANLPRITMLPPERAMRDGLNGPDAPGPDRLIGLTAEAIQKMLGTPDFKRRDPPAEIWQYRNESCLLDVFLYLGDGEYRVTHVEARGHSVARVPGTECLLESLAR